MNDTVSNHYKAAICLTTRAGCGSKNKFPLPAETNWFDIYIVADKPDCSDDETVWLDLTVGNRRGRWSPPSDFQNY